MKIRFRQNKIKIVSETKNIVIKVGIKQNKIGFERKAV